MKIANTAKALVSSLIAMAAMCAWPSDSDVAGIVRTNASKMASAASAEGFNAAETFRNPPVEHAPGFFWMWKDCLEANDLIRQIEDMYANGIRGVCVHPFPKEFRPGRFHSDMSPPYLSDEYIAVLKKVCDRAGELGMNFWLYDEGGWPSGGACGLVAASDKEGRWLPVTIMPSDADPGYRVVAEKAYGVGRKSYPSIIEKGLVERFIGMTHERLYDALSEAFGRQIKFAFTDEPSYHRNFWASKLPWARDFPECFKAKKGYDIMPHMKDIVHSFHTPDPDVIPYRLDYYEVVSDLFVERYLLPVRDWCRAHGIRSSGHVDGEDLPEAACRYGNGNVMKTLRAMDAPGVDVIWRQIWIDKGQGRPGRQPPFPRYASSAAHQIGSRYVLSESFGIYGDSCTPSEKRWLVDYQMLRGVNQFVFGYYADAYTGQWMTLFEPHCGPSTPMWRFEAPYYRYIHRISAILASGVTPTDVAVFYDARGFWAGGIETDIAAAQHYAAATALDRHHVEYDFLDEDPIEAAKIEDGALCVGEMRYRTLVVPSGKWMRPGTREKLESFKTAGGRVLGMSDIPSIRPACRIESSFARDIRVAKRVKGGETVYFIVNESPDSQKITIAFDEAGDVVLADAETGTFTEVKRGKDGSIPYLIPGCGSGLFFVNAKLSARSAHTAGATVLRIDSGWRVEKTVSHIAGPKAIEVVKGDGIKLETALGDWRPLLGWHFSGTARYGVEFDWQRDPTEVVLDLGKVCWACRATLNGTPLQDRYTAPFVWNVTPKRGRNVLVVEVANTLANALSDSATRMRIEGDFSSSASPYEPRVSLYDKENNESGLFGPVVIRRLLR